ncbi:unnamed protein product [Trifolium pratense]|uniref:Uncharacterized protein n=1 Tax=Trifolium pratense TaxID=57577 RepID=A0ACB0KUW4_TRIPR|nr:unnamed protein product [Trifolium pratense]
MVEILKIVYALMIFLSLILVVIGNGLRSCETNKDCAVEFGHELSKVKICSYQELSIGYLQTIHLKRNVVVQ